jgi:hypothetical protein
MSDRRGHVGTLSIIVATLTRVQGAGLTFSINAVPSFAKARNSHSTWIQFHNSGDYPEKAPKRVEAAGVIERFPRSLSDLGGSRAPVLVKFK